MPPGTAQTSTAIWTVPAAVTEQQKTRALEDARLARVANRSAVTHDMGLAWPKPRGRRVGKPSRKDRWVEMLYDAISNDQALPPGVTQDPPEWWRPGMPMEPFGLGIKIWLGVPGNICDASTFGQGIQGQSTTPVRLAKKFSETRRVQLG